MKREMTCIICPRGCAMTAELCGETVTVTGNSCHRGAEYAQNECMHPVRTVTATVRVSNRPDTMVPVKTQTPVAKEKMTGVMAVLRKCTVAAPIARGDVILENVFGSRIVATKNLE